MKKKLVLGILLTTLVALMAFSVAAAQDVDTEEPETLTVEGTVIAVGEDSITVLTEDEEGNEVEVELFFEEGEYTHAIAGLIGDYFGGASLEDFADALELLEDFECVIVSIEEVEDDEENITWEVTCDDDTVVEIDDEEVAEELMDALDLLEVEFEATVGEDDELTVGDPGDEVQEYHDDGVGFGVLVKVYAIAEQTQEACEEAEAEDDAEEEDVEEEEEPAEEEEPGEEDLDAEEGDVEEEEEDECGVTVEELIDMINDGWGLGQLFQEFGKPTLMGVGHIRQAGDAEGEAAANQCKNGGWEDFGDQFRNQGDCVSFFSSGKDADGDVEPDDED